ncbi:hypothetical protein ACLKA7_016569 [Drosophila subpalustris]
MKLMPQSEPANGDPKCLATCPACCMDYAVARCQLPVAFGFMRALDSSWGRAGERGEEGKVWQAVVDAHLPAQTMRMPQRDDVENVAGHVAHAAKSIQSDSAD